MTIYTDGSCRKNPGPGGFGIIIVQDNKVINAYQERAEKTTNNRMEMSAIIWALENYGDESHRGNGFLIPIVYSDSMYCVNSFTNWIKGWKANGWTRAGGKKLENLDLIKKYDSLVNQGYMIDLRHVAGHKGNEWNEMADQLATGKISVSEVLSQGKIKTPGQVRTNYLS